MALRIPGKGKFKPIKPTVRRPPVIARPRPATAPSKPSSQTLLQQVYDRESSPDLVTAASLPADLSGAPPLVSTVEPPTVATFDPPQVSSDLPPTVHSEIPPSVVPVLSEPSANDRVEILDSATLAAALVASIAPRREAHVDSPRSKRMRPQDRAEEGSSTPKRRRAGAGTGAGAGMNEGAKNLDDGLEDAAGQQSGTDPKRRGPRGKYGSRGRAGTASDRRLAVNKQRDIPSHPELDGVEPNDMVGIPVVPTAMTMKDLATVLVSQGRVSARTVKLHHFQREEDDRKRRERATKIEDNWRKRQIVRRKHRVIKNGMRDIRRSEATARGEDPNDVVSDDSIDSEEEFEPQPDRLTPPGSPREQGRNAPLRLDHNQEAEAGAEGEDAADEEGGLGLDFDTGAGEVDGEIEDARDDYDVGETMEDFQLPDEEGEGVDLADFEGLPFDDAYTGGQLDEDGNWIEGENNAALLHQRNEENRRRILEGVDERRVEVIDDDVQFVNASSWGKKVMNDRWTVEETELFFSVLRETGENYTLMKAYFPGRTVRQLKKKGNRENKVNSDRMTEAILNRKPMDKAYLAKSAGFNIERPYDRENDFLDDVAKEKDRVVRLDTEAAALDEQDHQLDQTPSP